MKEVNKKQKLKKRTKNCFFGKGIDWENQLEHKVKAIFTFDPKDINEVRWSSNGKKLAKTVLSLNNKQCLVTVSTYELGYELSQHDEYDVVFKLDNEKDYKLTVAGNTLKLIV